MDFWDSRTLRAGTGVMVPLLFCVAAAAAADAAAAVEVFAISVGAAGFVHWGPVSDGH